GAQLGVGPALDLAPQDDGCDHQRARTGAPPRLVDAGDRGQSPPGERTLVAVEPRIPPDDARAWAIGNSHDSTQRTPHRVAAAIRYRPLPRPVRTVTSAAPG